MSIPITVLKNGVISEEFSSLQEVYRYLQSFVESNEDLYDVINFGIDDEKSWTYQNHTYEFITTPEHKAERADRKTRKH